LHQHFMCCISQNKPTWNYSILFLLFRFSQKQFCCQCLFESSSIIFCIHFAFKNIVHPWHVVEYSSTSLNIPSTSTKYSWKDSLLFTCPCSCVHQSCSHAHKITSMCSTYTQFNLPCHNNTLWVFLLIKKWLLSFSTTIVTT
jgi:hypothetical protein